MPDIIINNKVSNSSRRRRNDDVVYSYVPAPPVIYYERSPVRDVDSPVAEYHRDGYAYVQPGSYRRREEILNDLTKYLAMGPPLPMRQAVQEKPRYIEYTTTATAYDYVPVKIVERR